MPHGSVHSIYITPQAGSPTQQVDSIHAVPGLGLEGDRYFGLAGTGHKRSGTGRDITLIEIEAIAAVQLEDGIHLTPGETRRNIITQGVALNHLIDREFKVGDVHLRGIRLCEPCQYLAGLTEARVLPALVHRGGLRAEILTEGNIHSGDPIITD